MDLCNSIIRFMIPSILFTLIHAKWNISTFDSNLLHKKIIQEEIKYILETEGLLLITTESFLTQKLRNAHNILKRCRARTIAGINEGGVFHEMIVRRQYNDTVGDASEEISCDFQVSHDFRSNIHQAGVRIAQSLGEDAIKFIQEGTHKEMFHLSTGISQNGNVPHWHTDAGVYLAMTSSFLDETEDENYIWIKEPFTERQTKVLLPNDSILIMGGSAFGMSKDLLGSAIRPVSHRSMESMKSRLWYGSMFLPSEKYEIRPNVRMDEWMVHPNAAFIGCHSSYDSEDDQSRIMDNNFLYTNRELRDLRAPECVSGKYCWKACLDIEKNICTLPDGKDCTTSDADTMKGHECRARPKPEEPEEEEGNAEIDADKGNDNKFDGFCLPGVGTDMFMDGFNLVYDRGPKNCLVFFFKGAELDNAVKFTFAWLGILCLCILSEFLQYLRRLQILDNAPLLHSVPLFFCSITLGYLIMLATMMYSYEMFLSVVFGLTIGNAIFGRWGREMIRIPAVNSDRSESVIIEEGGRTACCH